MSYVPAPQFFEYTIEAPVNNDLDKNTEYLMEFINNHAHHPFQIQHWKDYEERNSRVFLITSQQNIHNLIYFLFKPFQASYTCYVKTRVSM
jgi:hypothetical protein